MNKRRKILFAVLLVDLLALGLFFGLAVFSYSADKIIPLYATGWELRNAVLDFFRWLPLVQFLGIAAALASADDNRDELVRRAIVPVCVLTVLFAAVALLVSPYLEASRASMLAASGIYNEALSGARQNLEKTELKAAREKLALCMSISPRDPRTVKLEELLSNAELKATRTAPSVPQPPAPKPKPASSAREYYKKALDFFDKDDYFSAHWYASMAARIDPADSDAKRLAAQAWKKIGEPANGAGSQEDAAFFSSKLEGYGLLNSGDPIGAYVLFKRLSTQRPRDADLRRYLAESKEAVERIAFFLDETRQRGSLFREVFLVLKAGASGRGPGAAVLAASSVLFTREAVYFHELEYFEAATAGERAPRVAFTALRAKLAGGRLFLICLDREHPEKRSDPVWKTEPDSGIASYIELDLESDEAYGLIAARDRPAALDIVRLWKAARAAPAYGIDRAPLIAELMKRSGFPFALFGASALGVLLGARFKRRNQGRFPRSLYLLTPLVAAAALPVFLLIERMDFLASAWAALLVPGLASLGLAAGLRAVVMFALVLLAAGARERSEYEP